MKCCNASRQLDPSRNPLPLAGEGGERVGHHAAPFGFVARTTLTPALSRQREREWIGAS
jgi:hypothetical protein